MRNNEIFQRLAKVTNVASLTPTERYSYEADVKNARDALNRMRGARQEGFAEGRAEGRAVGHAEGHAEGLAEGRASGRAEGRAEGLIEGESRFAQLTQLLLGSGRTEDLSRAVTDVEYRKELYLQYNL